MKSGPTAVAIATFLALLGLCPDLRAAPTATATSAVTAHALTSQDAEAWLDGLMPTALETASVPGAVVVIVKDGQVLLEKGYGFADEKNRVPVDPKTTLFRPGSATKLFTWTAVMQLVEQGKLDLDVDVNRYLDFKIPPRDGQPITLRDIMTHRTGFEERMKGLITFDEPEAPLDQTLAGNMPARIAPAGAASAYSNYATGIAGHIVERVAGMPYDDYIEHDLLAPLAMQHSTFRQPPPKALSPELAVGYEDSDTPGKGFEVVSIAPAGALSTTGDDMAHFMIAHLQDGRYGNAQILRPETARTMHDTITRAFPDLNGIALGFYEQNINGHRVIGHGGDLSYFHSQLSLFLDDHVGLFVSVNASGKDDLGVAIRDSVFHGFSDRYFPRVEDVQAIAPATAMAHARLIAGRYVNTSRAETTFVSLINLLSATVVEANADGTITAKAGHEPETFVEVRPFLWHQVGGHDLLQAKLVDGQVASWSTDALAFAFAFQPLHGLAGTGLELPLLGASIVVLLASVLAWPIGFAARRWYGVPRPAPGPAFQSRRAINASAGVALLASIAWTALFGVVAQTMSPHLDGWVHAVQALSWVGFAGGWIVAARNVFVHFRKGNRLGSRIWAIVQFLTFSLLLWIAVHYHLVGASAAY